MMVSHLINHIILLYLEHALLQLGAGGQHPGDVPLDKGAFGGAGL